MQNLMSIRAWLKSKTLRFFGIAGGLAAIDASFFQGDIGMMVLQFFLTAVNAIPFIHLTGEQGISTLVVLISGIGVWLRSITHESLGDK